MKQFLQLGITTLLIAFSISSAHAATPEQICRARKNAEVAKFFTCRHKALSGLAESKFGILPIKCNKKFRKGWRSITKKINKLEGTCLDTPLELTDYKPIIKTHLNNITTQLGKNLKGKAAKKRCRALKTLAAGRYTACRHRAESKLARTGNTTKYNSRIVRCEGKLEKSWSKIIQRTQSLGTICFDHQLAVDNYKSMIDTHTEKVAGVLAGTDEFDPVTLSVTGSPIALIQDDAADTLIITNTSSKATALNIESDFTGTALQGKVTESGNTCSSVAPGENCTLTFTPGSNLVSLTNFSIQGSNTDAISASLEILAPATAIISVGGSPLSLTANGPTGNLIITNTSGSTTALNISSDFSGTALDGNVTETGNTCASVAPFASCTLTYTPGSTLLTVTTFTVLGSNTNILTPAISIASGSTLTSVNSTSGTAAGGTGVTLSGAGLTGATSVTFDGVAATSVNVVNSTTVTAVTPAHAAGVVDIVIDTPAGGATLANSYTYLATAVGQSSGGGTIACLNGGLNNFIASTADNATSIQWGTVGVVTSAQSDTDGATNTATIVAELGSGGTYAAKLCNNFEIDSQGNTPCQAGNTCYNDWFLPAKDQVACLYTNAVAIGGFGAASYWSSTEFTGLPAFWAWRQFFANGSQSDESKDASNRARCVRAFTP